MWDSRALPVLREADFRAEALREGSTIEIKCITGPSADSRYSGEWVFFVVDKDGRRSSLFTQQIRERVITSPIGLLGFAVGKLGIREVRIPTVAGETTSGMFASAQHPSND